MFEPEIRDATTVKRWAIVRTIRDQSLAEHSFYVTLYASELANWVHPGDVGFQLAVTQYSLWHDLKDEIFTGDIPGPAKRRMVSDKEHYDDTVARWSRLVFGNDPYRFGQWHEWEQELKCIVKIADELDQVFELSGELRLGNTYVRSPLNSALDRAMKWVDELFDEDPKGAELKAIISVAAHNHMRNDPKGPVIFTPASA